MAGSNFIDARKAVDLLTEAFSHHKAILDRTADSLTELNRKYSELPSDYIRTQKQLLDLRRQEEKAQQELIKTQQQLERLKQQELRTDQDGNRVKQQILRTEQQVERSKQAQQRTLAAESRTRQTLIREQQQQVRLSERERKNVEKANSAYQRLRDSLNRAEKEYKDLAAAQGLSNQSTIAAQQNVRRLRQQVDAINKPIGRMNENVGNYPKNFGIAAGAVRSLVGAFGLIEGVRMAWNLTKESLALAREARGVQFAFERLGEAGVKAFTDVRQASRGTLSDLDIKRALVDFDNFNIDVAQAADLFEFLTVRATQTGKSIDYLRDSLVEGLSKESKLRIDNLGISAQELNEELEKTPDFVEAVANIARREVAEAGKILDEAGNSASRYAASVENAKLAFGELLSSADTGILGWIADRFDALTTSLKLTQIAFSILREGWDVFMGSVREVAKEIPILQKVLDGMAIFFKAMFVPALSSVAQYIRALGATFAGLGASISSVTKSVKTFFRILSMLGDIEIDLLNPAKTAKQAKEIIKIASLTMKNAGGNAAEAYTDAFNRVYNAKSKETVKTIKEESKEIEENTDKKKQALKAIYGSIAYYEQVIKQLEEERKKLATNSLEYNSYKDRINEASMALNNLKTQLNGVNELDIDLDKAKAMEEFFKTIEEATKPNPWGLEGPDASGINEGLRKEIDDLNKAEAQKTAIVEAENQRRVDIVFGSLEQFGKSYGVDLGAFRKLFDEKKNTISDYSSAAQEILSFALNQRLVGYDVELQKAAETRDAILNNERTSEEQRRAAEKEFEREEARIKNEQAKKERENALIQIAVNTAVGVTKALATVPPPASFVLAGIITTMGALQAGLVASQPLPKFEHGTDNAPQGWAIVDEAGPEIHTDKSGRVKSTGSSKGANLRYLEKGDKIFPHGMAPSGNEVASLQNILWNAGINLYGNDGDDNKDDRMLHELQGLRKDNKSLKRTVSSLANRPINVTIEDKSKPYYG